MLLIKDGYIITMCKEDLPHGDILIVDKKIAKIGEHLSVESEKDVQIIEAKGALVMPGIIESHCHIGITEEKVGTSGDDCNELGDPVTPYLRAIDAINPFDPAFHDCLKAGITGVMTGPGSSNVVGGQFVFLKTHGRILDDMIVLNPAAMKVSFGENPKRNYGQNGKLPGTRMTIAAMLRQELTEAKQYLEEKKQATRKGSTFKQNFRYECWEPVFERKIPIKAHVHRTDDIVTAIRIAKEFNLNMTLDHCSEGHIIADFIKEAGFPAIVGPTLAARSKTEVSRISFKTAGILNQHGILISIATDHPVSIIQSLPLCAGLCAKEGLGVKDALKAITINAAKICNVDKRVGSIEPGKDADLAIFSGNPLEVFTNTLYTIVNGEIAFDYTQVEK